MSRIHDHKKKCIHLCSTITLLGYLALLAMSTPLASAADLQVGILQYQPTPAELGKYVSVWVKVENRGFGNAEDLVIKMVPSYPFSLDSPANAEKKIGVLSPGDAYVHDYRLFVDGNAKEGLETIELWYMEGTENIWYKKKFDIRVGSDTFDSRGSVQLQGSPVTDPKVFMPGDKGSIEFTLTNAARTSSIPVGGKEFDTNARIQSATLEGSDGIKVTTGSYYGKGVLGPGESVTITFNVEVDEDTPEGTYYLDLEVVGNSHALSSNWRIPVKVDPSSVKVIPSSHLVLENGVGKIKFDVVNVHQNKLFSVSIRPDAEGIEFSPKEYFIGSMDPDELFTIQFDVKAMEGKVFSRQNLTLKADHRNGANQHSVFAGSHELRNNVVKKNNTSTIVAINVAVVLAGLAYIIYKRKKVQ